MGKGDKLIYCTLCYQEKLASEYSPTRINSNGRSGRCKKCLNALAVEARAKKNRGKEGTPEASLPPGIEDEYELYAFGPPDLYLKYVMDITEKSGAKYAGRKSGRGVKPKGLE